MIELKFKFKNCVASNAKKLVMMFVDEWVSDVVLSTDYDISSSNINKEIILIQLTNGEDATALKLHGVPHQLTKYVESCPV